MKKDKKRRGLVNFIEAFGRERVEENGKRRTRG